MQQYLEAGKIVSTHGVRGEMKLEVWGDDLALLKACGRVYLSPQGGTDIQVLGVRPQGNMALLTLKGVEDMDAARALVGRVLYLNREDIRLPRGRYFLQDLIGCRVEDADTGRLYGRITEVTHPGAQDLYTVQNEQGDTFYLPAVPEFVKERLPEQGRVLVTPIPGLFGEAENGDQEGVAP